MSDATKTIKDLRVKNVSLHSRGKTEHGTLYLTRHHLIFSYVVDPSGSASSSTTDAAAKPKPKEIWVPYPIINHCTLRPSYVANQTIRATSEYSSSGMDTRSDTDDAFPPVFGTSSLEPFSTHHHSRSPYASPRRSASPAPNAAPTQPDLTRETGRPPALRIRRRDFQMMAFHFHPTPPSTTSNRSPDDSAREVFFTLRTRCCLPSPTSMHAFHFHPPAEETACAAPTYDARAEFARMGIPSLSHPSPSTTSPSPGAAWRVSEINADYSFAPTYPSLLAVPASVSDSVLKYGGPFRSKARIPALSYLHGNGGSITRSSQPLVGVQGKRNVQDERLVGAIWSSHSLGLQGGMVGEGGDRGGMENGSGDRKEKNGEGAEEGEVVAAVTARKVYGSSRRNIIADARPKINMLANRAMGGGIEDAAHYAGSSGIAVEKVFLNIANIHAMRSSLDKVVESMAHSDYLDIRPNQDLLNKSGWLGYIAGLLEGADMIAKAVGLGGSHVLVHCSDGWDRTAQVSGLAEIMLDPHYRTLNGFITLVQKDFLSFGHKFQDRHGILGCEKWFEIENERVTPSRTKEQNGNDGNTINTFSAKAFSGAKNWFDKNRNNLFRQQPLDHRSGSESPDVRSGSPVPDAVVHSPPSSNVSTDKEHRVDEKEIAPIFHQFLDAVFQLLSQHPNAFEFNERFLRRLFYQAYCGQYREFLFNSERTRAEAEGGAPSVWPHFLSRRHEFINPSYVSRSEDTLLLPLRRPQDREIDMRWWSALFGRKDEEMPRFIATSTHELGSTSGMGRSNDGMSSLTLSDQNDETAALSNSHQISEEEHKPIEKAKSVPSFQALRHPQTDSQGVKEKVDQREAAMFDNAQPQPEHDSKAQSIVETDMGKETSADHINTKEQSEADDAGDPLGVTMTSVPAVQNSGSRLDFAAFARGSAYSDRS